MKLSFRVFILTLLIGPACAFGSAPATGTRVIIQVDTTAGAIRVDKVHNGKSKHIESRTLPIVKDSWKAGWYRPIRLERKFRTHHGNVYLKDVIFLAGSRTIRTSRHFDQIAAAKTPVAGAIVLPPDFGSIVYDTVDRFGTSNTWIQIRK